jgi:DNA-binding response OmpR family regulator
MPARIFEHIKDRSILLVDDDESIRDSMSLYFLGRGVTIDTCETAEEGIRYLESRHYDIIITDYKLPGMDGLGFICHVRSKGLDCYIILMTAYGRDAVIEAAFELGADDCIVKPFNAASVTESLTRFAERRGWSPA